VFIFEIINCLGSSAMISNNVLITCYLLLEQDEIPEAALAMWHVNPMGVLEDEQKTQLQNLKVPSSCIHN